MQSFHKHLAIGDAKSSQFIFLFTRNMQTNVNDKVSFKVIFAWETFIISAQAKVTRNMSQDTCILTQCLHFILAMNFHRQYKYIYIYIYIAILFFQLDKIDINESQTIEGVGA